MLNESEKVIYMRMEDFEAQLHVFIHLVIGDQKGRSAQKLYADHIVVGVNFTNITEIDGLQSIDAIPRDIGSLLFLEDLDLRKNNFFSLPDTVSDLLKLKNLKLDDCAELELLPDMPTNLFTLSAANRTSLKNVSVSKFRHVPRLFLTNCSKIEEISG